MDVQGRHCPEKGIFATTSRETPAALSGRQVNSLRTVPGGNFKRVTTSPETNEGPMTGKHRPVRPPRQHPLKLRGGATSTRAHIAEGQQLRSPVRQRELGCRVDRGRYAGRAPLPRRLRPSSGGTLADSTFSSAPSEEPQGAAAILCVTGENLGLLHRSLAQVKQTIEAHRAALPPKNDRSGRGWSQY